MVRRIRSNETDQFVQQLIKTVIESQLGSIDTLPAAVTTRLYELYGEFIPAYMEIIRTRDAHPEDWRPRNLAIESDVLEDMLHFYSDYQDITRSFKRINRQVKNLLRIDRRADPHRFERGVQEIVSGGQGSSLMDSIVDP